MTDYNIKDMLGSKRCPKCKSEVILIWKARGQTFECTKCKDTLAQVPYPEVSGSKK